MPPRRAKQATAAAPAAVATPAAAAADGDGSTLTEYELQRLAHIRRNQEYMARLGVLQSAEALRPAAAEGEAAPRRARKPRAEVPAEELRRSGRLVGAAAEHDGAELDAASESEDDERRAPKRARRTTAPERDAAARELLEHARRWLAESRAALQLGAGGAAPSAAAEWRAEAVRRWGDGVAASGLAADDPAWCAFVTSRLTSPPPPSPLELMQEFYACDTWQLLCCCVLMGRVASHAVKTTAVAAFFARCPTPTALLEAPEADLHAIMAPLGLFPGRMQSLVAVARRYLEAPVFEVSLSPEHKIYGIGEFGVASWRIFCKGDLSITPADATLRQFLGWQRRHAAKAARRAAAGGDAPAAGEGDDDESSDEEAEE